LGFSIRFRVEGVQTTVWTEGVRGAVSETNRTTSPPSGSTCFLFRSLNCTVTRGNPAACGANQGNKKGLFAPPLKADGTHLRTTGGIVPRVSGEDSGHIYHRWINFVPYRSYLSSMDQIFTILD